MRIWYISFAGDDGFRGAIIVRAATFEDALTRAHALGINPGGEVLGCGVSEAPPERFMDRLLNRAEIAEMDRCLSGGNGTSVRVVVDEKGVVTRDDGRPLGRGTVPKVN